MVFAVGCLQIDAEFFAPCQGGKVCCSVSGGACVYWFVHGDGDASVLSTRAPPSEAGVYCCV